MTQAPPSLLPHLWRSGLVSGVLAIALGIAVWTWPGISITVAAILFGVSLLFIGIQQVFFAFTLRVSTVGRILPFVSGAASLVLGVIALSRLSDGVLLLAIWIGVGFIFRGVATTVSAISDPTLPGRWLNVVVGAVSLIAGVVIMARPFASIELLANIVGIWLIVVGVMEVVAAIGIRYYFTQKPEAADESTEEPVQESTEESPTETTEESPKSATP